MRNFSLDVVAALEGKEPVFMGMILFDFPSGEYAFWDGDEDFEHEGVTYKPGKPIKLADMNSSYGLEAQGLEITLSSNADPGLTPDVLATIDEEDYIGRPVTISLAYFTPGGLLLNVERIWRGYVDGFDHVDKVGGETELICRCESKAMDTFKKGHRTRSPSDQARIDPTDRALDGLATEGKTELNWGRLPEKPGKK